MKKMKKMKKMAVISCVLCMLVSFSGCGKLQVSREIAKVNGNVVTKAEYMYYLENVKQQMLSESGTTDAEGFWEAEIDGVKAGEAAKKRALEEMLRVEIACVKAEEKGLSVAESDLKQIRATVKTTDSEQKAQVDSVKDVTGLTDELLIDVLAKTTLASSYASDLNMNDPAAVTPEEADIRAAYEKDYVHVKHILISSTQEATAAEEGAEAEATVSAEEYKAQKKELADSVLEKAKAGQNFDGLVKEYGEDPGMESSPEGYTFTKGQMVAAFETASFALGVNEISDLVETEYGWHIIKRLALPTAGEEYETAIQGVKGTLAQDMYNALLNSYKSDMTIEIYQNVIDGIKIK
ncbi:MAG: peptidylprolyl isomerase [Clostridia bacterium]|nr:peptidylprolyl isomerase [Clostridia bacterium]